MLTKGNQNVSFSIIIHALKIPIIAYSQVPNPWIWTCKMHRHAISRFRANYQATIVNQSTQQRNQNITANESHKKSFKQNKTKHGSRINKTNEPAQYLETMAEREEIDSGGSRRTNTHWNRSSIGSNIRLTSANRTGTSRVGGGFEANAIR